MPSDCISPLIFGENLSLGAASLKAANEFSTNVLVIGGGVTGLVTAWVLLDRGYHVTIVAKEWATWTQAHRLTSQIAGELWEYPPAVCGQHTDAISLANSKRWCMISYKIWDTIASDSQMAVISGVKMRPSHFFFPCAIEDDLAHGVRGFMRDRRLHRVPGINRQYGVVDAYEHLAPMIDTDRAMGWLMGLVQAKGARFVTEEIHGELYVQEDELLTRFKADAIVNATGLAGFTTAGDESCYPIRGALIRVINDNTNFPKINQAMTITADAVHSADEIVFIVPRNDNILLLGGIAEPHQQCLDYTLETPIVKRMRQRCEDFFPQLKNAQTDPDYPLAQGLRPFRGTNVRVERELRPIPSRIVHSYGQGGAGWSLAFGCAADVADLVAEAVQNLPAIPMAMPENPAKEVPREVKARL
ncbi:FAD-dependent oxidoreductase [Aspergillus homomorphus CBS 101889]|uniref:FAD dependent oxidoreductase n=1 Tax=Aspergillus homomorphus (strain CBS 101889) TaxID=1450537 RepID=A0A395HGH4_ASPHC|nr:FAD dependent oxidoreductase [Aspergillus homomorphus CBS 101889]RAL06609.1 FAD dependent oxidoreductase [Aspergillus homomorphus CBS 101889]